jgi:3-oxoacyl-[acyl-carrier-protein] synthase-3
MADASELILKRNNLTNTDVDWLVPHQANKRIIDATVQNEPRSKFVNIENMDKYQCQLLYLSFIYLNLLLKRDT